MAKTAHHSSVTVIGRAGPGWHGCSDFICPQAWPCSLSVLMAVVMSRVSGTQVWFLLASCVSPSQCPCSANQIFAFSSEIPTGHILRCFHWPPGALPQTGAAGCPLETFPSDLPGAWGHAYSASECHLLRAGSDLLGHTLASLDGHLPGVMDAS